MIGEKVIESLIRLCGMSAIFFYTAAMHAGFVIFVVYRMLAREPLAQSEREPFQPVPEQPAPLHLSADGAAAKQT